MSDQVTPSGKTRLRDIPVRMLVPNLITLLALCAGLTAIRFAIEGRLELALGAIVFAAALDGIDGRVARMLKGTSKFGAELDSLADFVNFGVVPGLVLYFWGLNTFGNVGWIACLVFAIAAGLRLARFNVSIADPGKPAWQSDFFVGMPAPMGAITGLLPIYVSLLGLPSTRLVLAVSALYVLAIAFMMVSQIPVFSGKTMGTSVPRGSVLIVFVAAVLFIAALVSFPWEVLTIGTLAYLVSLPFGFGYYRRLEREHRARGAEVKLAEPAPDAFGPLTGQDEQAPDAGERTPPRLN
jgi:CDP-diacylglycerol--serine O-phosphatidyltransferase